MNKIIDALSALARAIPDLDGVDVDIIADGLPWVQMRFRSDEGACAAANALGIDIERTGIPSVHWLQGDGDNDERLLHVSGPHHRAVKIAEPDSDAVAAALAQAEEAVQQ